MRILYMEQKWGVKTEQGSPSKIDIVEQWASLEEARDFVEERLRARGDPYTVREQSHPQLKARGFEIDVQDVDDTLIGLFDADTMETELGIPAEDLGRFLIHHGGNLERALLESDPSLKERMEKQGVKIRDLPQQGYLTNFDEIRRLLNEQGRSRGVIAEEDGSARKVTIWNALLHFQGEIRPVIVWDGEDGPVRPERIGLGRSGGRGVFQLPPGVMIISWNRVRQLLRDGQSCYVGRDIIDS